MTFLSTRKSTRSPLSRFIPLYSIGEIFLFQKVYDVKSIHGQDKSDKQTPINLGPKAYALQWRLQRSVLQAFPQPDPFFCPLLYFSISFHIFLSIFILIVLLVLRVSVVSFPNLCTIQCLIPTDYWQKLSKWSIEGQLAALLERFLVNELGQPVGILGVERAEGLDHQVHRRGRAMRAHIL